MENENYIFFWHEYAENGYLSNWYESPFVIDSFRYRHVEQYLMAEKAKIFNDLKNHSAILKAKTPKECKDLGRKVTPYDDNVWANVRYDVLKTGVYEKFSQNTKLAQMLLSTGDAILAEASPFDAIFGIKLAAKDAARIQQKDWPGTNLLGKALMDVRSEIKDKIIK